ncbi:MOSC domain-containing protein [Candidatus Woesearchaeota archaeon]|nr:MOSC domain-containing protein [Candidatus Woesearchaeota archaeon]
MAYIFQISIKPKTEGERGLPKLRVEKVVVTFAGLEGDYNTFRTMKKGATPDMALLIMPVSTLDELNKEGWPVKPGDIGENLTLYGASYPELRSGKKYKAGDVIFEITTSATPCKNLALLSYVGEEKITEFMRTLVNRRGWYAKILQEGTLEQGMTLEELTERKDEWPILHSPFL